jgi:MYXO-CTERM domain-containing protein
VRGAEGRSPDTSPDCVRLRRFVACARLLAGAAAITVAAPALGAVAPHRSATTLVTSNGRVVVGYDVPARRVTSFLEHPYRMRSDGAETRDLAFDLYPGVRIGGTGAPGTWLTEIEPERVEYEPGTGIVRSVRSLGELVIDEYHFAPIELAEHALVSLVKVERKSGAAAPIDGFLLFNFHLGEGAPVPGAAGETIQWDAARDAWIEWGPSGLTLAYGSIGKSAHHGSSPDNPFPALTSGSDLADNSGTGGPIDDAAAGTQWSLGALSAGQSAWFGAFVVLDAESNVTPRVEAIRSWIGTRGAEQILADEKAAWSAWHVAPPAGLSTLEQSLWQQSMAVLRMGQVREPGKSDGQILASLPPGMWNISWVRDMAYAVVALARSGHPAEAKRAIEFQLGADSGKYQDYVGRPYQISITRYFGDGVEETDSNENGPNIEFDGFGLFLWTLHEYVEASGDTAALASHWPVVSEKVADVLVGLQEPSGLIAPDSSIWEVHWNGQQKRFAYTTITAANGLCRAASLAEKVGDGARAETYRAAGRKAQAALIAMLSAPDGTLAQSLEDLQLGTGFLDAAAIEAVGLGLVDPAGRAAAATLAAMKAKLVPQSGRGFMRNDDGGWYDSQEWVFVDLRTVQAMRLAAHPDGPELLGWITAQGSENYGLISELHDATSADYRGEMPMIGFGAGAYAIALLDRQSPSTPLPCGSYADETPPDGGAGGGAGAAGAAGSKGGGDADDDGGCGCRTRGGAAQGAATLLLALALARRRRKSRH